MQSHLSLSPPILKNEFSLTFWSEDEGGIWLDEDYANAHSLSAGDTITLTYDSLEKEMEISGIVLHSEYIYFITSSAESVPDHMSNGYAYISEQSAQELFGAVNYSQLRIRFSPEASVSREELRADLEELLGERLYAVQLKEDKISITQVENEIDQIQKMAILFSLVFLLLSILSMYTTMSRMVNNQIVQIGTMQSLGFSNFQIYIHYSLYGLTVIVIGSIIGMLLGLSLVAELVLNIKQSILTLPEWNRQISADSVLLIIAILLVCTASAILTARKIVKNSPALTIRGLIQTKNLKIKNYKRSRCSYDLLWTIRGIKAHPVRYIMAVIAICGSMVLMVAGIGIWDSLNTSYDKVFSKQLLYDYTGTVINASRDMVRKDFEAYTFQLAQTASAAFFFSGKEQEGVLTILDEGEQIALYDHDSHKKINLSDMDAVITYKLAQTLGVGIGDEIEYRQDQASKTLAVTISAIVDAKMPQGLFISAENTQEFLPNTIYLADDEAFKHASDMRYISGLISIDKQKENTDEMMDSVHSIVYILILASFILSAVILYNLGLLAFIERTREYATMKVLGFYQKEMVGIVLKESIINMVSGLIIGIPLSLLFLKLYVAIVSMDSVEWTPYIKPTHFVIVLLVVTVFSFMINMLVCSKIRRVNMVEALKSVE